MQSFITECSARTLDFRSEYKTECKSKTAHASSTFLLLGALIIENADSDCSMTNAVKSVDQFGVSVESICPRTTLPISRHVSSDQRAYRTAENFKIRETLRVEIDLH